MLAFNKWCLPFLIVTYHKLIIIVFWLIAVGWKISHRLIANGMPVLTPQTVRFRSSCSQMFFKIGVLKNFANFTGRHLYWSPFLIKLQTFCNFIKKRLQQRCLPVKFVKFLRTHSFTEHIRWPLLMLETCFTACLSFKQNSNRCVKERLWHLKNAFFIKSWIFVLVP